MLTIVFIVLTVVAGLAGCASVTTPGSKAPKDCLRVAQARLERAPAWGCLPTLDGQCSPLEWFFDACADLWPDCVLYPKFYLWENEVRVVTSHSPRGPVNHRVRIYHNILYACRPAYKDPRRTHGDVAEFYDEAGRFMGLAVYMGKGLYCPLQVPGRKAVPRVQ